MGRCSHHADRDTAAGAAGDNKLLPHSFAPALPQHFQSLLGIAGKLLRSPGTHIWQLQPL